jgi:hypothetical protein
MRLAKSSWSNRGTSSPWAAKSPQARITPNDYIVGRKSGVPREVDLAIRQHIGQYEMLIVVDCKDYNKAADVNSRSGRLLALWTTLVRTVV